LGVIELGKGDLVAEGCHVPGTRSIRRQRGLQVGSLTDGTRYERRSHARPQFPSALVEASS
jgi:hypothetical protein